MGRAPARWSRARGGDGRCRAVPRIDRLCAGPARRLLCRMACPCGGSRQRRFRADWRSRWRRPTRGQRDRPRRSRSSGRPTRSRRRRVRPNQVGGRSGRTRDTTRSPGLHRRKLPGCEHRWCRHRWRSRIAVLRSSMSPYSATPLLGGPVGALRRSGAGSPRRRWSGASSRRRRRGVGHCPATLARLADRLPLVAELRQDGDEAHIEQHPDDEADEASDLWFLDEEHHRQRPENEEDCGLAQ